MRHGLHIGTVLGPALLLAFWAGWADLRAWMHRQGPRLASVPVLLAALASVGAGLLHAVVAPAHAAAGVLYGAFFFGTALLQLGWSVAVVRVPRQALVTVGAALNASVLGLWGLSRTVGVPLGRPEPFGVTDVTVAVLELVVVAACVAALRSPVRPGRTVPRAHWVSVAGT